MSYTTPTGATAAGARSTSRRDRRVQPGLIGESGREVGATLPRPPCFRRSRFERVPTSEAFRQENLMAHLVTAIIKPFKLEEVKEALRGAGILGLTVSRGPGLRPPRRQDRSLPGQRVQDRLRPEGQDRGARRHQRRRQGHRHHRRTRARTGKIGDGKIWADARRPAHAHPHRRARRRCHLRNFVPMATET